MERQNPEQLSRIYQAMNVLGEQSWRINNPMLDVVLGAVAENSGLANIPITQPGMVLEKPDRTPRFRTQATKGQVSGFCHHMAQQDDICWTGFVPAHVRLVWLLWGVSAPRRLATSMCSYCHRHLPDSACQTR